ncbi:MAG: glycosyltransferase [Kiritimatiellae bacterium]|jgi:undecaprenyl-phosphate 4-deoxy-4-formamido-L-arabinose transferase|nr:glycosyltransferase [Kiritimatiellia bacterium]
MTETLSVVIPVFNEEDNLDELIKRTLAACDKTEIQYEIILVDDGSKDKSVAILEKASNEFPTKVISVLLNRNYGQHAAVMAGLEASKGSIVVTLDADLQNPPEEIPNLVNEVIEKGVDVVGTIRENRQDSIFRKLPSAMINKAVQKATGVAMSDYGCMLRAYRRNIVDAMLQCHERSTFIPILANSFAAKTSEIKVAHAERSAGDSKYNFIKLIALQFDLVTCMTTFPIRMLTYIGTFIAMLGTLFGVLIIILRLIHGAAWAAEGVFTLFAILFIFVGLQFLAMGLLGEYIGRIYEDVRARPRYFIREIKGKTTL